MANAVLAETAAEYEHEYLLCVKFNTKVSRSSLMTQIVFVVCMQQEQSKPKTRKKYETFKRYYLLTFSRNTVVKVRLSHK